MWSVPRPKIISIKTIHVIRTIVQIRNWYGGDSDLVETFKNNHQLAGECWIKVILCFVL